MDRQTADGQQVDYGYEPQHHRHRSVSYAPGLEEEKEQENPINPLQLSHNRDGFDDEIVFGTDTGTDTDRGGTTTGTDTDQADDELGTSDEDIASFGGDDDSSSDDDDDASGDTGTDANKDVTEAERLRLFKPYNIRIKFGRGFVLLLMLLLGVGATVWVYLYLRGEEQDDSIDAFDAFSRSIQDGIEIHSQQLEQAFRALSEDLTAYSIHSTRQFPFVTPPYFEVSAFHARTLASVPFLALLPLVSLGQRDAWEDYTVNNNERWIDESQSIISQRGQSLPDNSTTTTTTTTESMTPFIFESSQDEGDIFSNSRATDRDLYAPIWTSSPPMPSLINKDMLSVDYFGSIYQAMLKTRGVVVGPVTNISTILYDTAAHDNNIHLDGNTNRQRPQAILLSPVFSNLTAEGDIVAFVAGVLSLDEYMSNVLPEGVEGMHIVVKNTKRQSFTYCMTGNRAEFCGEGDQRNITFQKEKLDTPFLTLGTTDFILENGADDTLCEYSVDIYSSSDFEDQYKSRIPWTTSILIAVVFVAMGSVFFAYDWFVQLQNKQLVGAAARASAMISSLFPANVRDRLFASAESKEAEELDALRPGNQTRLRRYLTDENPGKSMRHLNVSSDDESVDENHPVKSKPIADLFPETTILFADIVGFTAWSSVREPAQVFTLLETLYAAFDEIAKRRRVFKVETVGDCYVAVTGLPNPRKDHAVVMARFTRDIMHRMRTLTKQMEVELGPDTGDLSMRAGMHSGPVTAGVLRGDRARFQLFGDTMNTAARMESTGMPGKIQMSEETAELLIAAGKEDWVRQREEVVHAKGKGALATFWLSLRSTESRRGTNESDDSAPMRRPSLIEGFIRGTNGKSVRFSDKTTRLIEWNVEVLLRLLKQIVAQRQIKTKSKLGESLSLLARVGGDSSSRKSAPLLNTGASSLRRSQTKLNNGAASSSAFSAASLTDGEAKNPLEEVVEVIKLPEFDPHTRMAPSIDTVEISNEVINQLSDLVGNISGMYRDNPFHSFEHASHVTMSVVKLLSRIVAPEFDEQTLQMPRGKQSAAYMLHDHTYGITSDPLTQFACVFSALIHDIEHQGVPNTQLVKEKAFIAETYKGRSVAEQNSVDLAWELFMKDKYSDLRRELCGTEKDRKRFRQLVVNTVMATDIMDVELKGLRNARWEKAFFGKEEAGHESSTENRNRKATIVIEHLIQASDVAHTMQHWNIYRKWNERLFLEMANAYDDGRALKHPVDFWYQGEIGFFDFYIIPLAKKLKNCGVFGVSSEEYLNYAMKNRQEWETRGHEVVSEMMEKLGKVNTTTRIKTWENKVQKDFARKPPKPTASGSSQGRKVKLRPQPKKGIVSTSIPSSVQTDGSPSKRRFSLLSNCSDALSAGSNHSVGSFVNRALRRPGRRRSNETTSDQSDQDSGPSKGSPRRAARRASAGGKNGGSRRNSGGADSSIDSDSGYAAKMNTDEHVPRRYSAGRVGTSISMESNYSSGDSDTDYTGGTSGRQSRRNSTTSRRGSNNSSVASGSSRRRSSAYGNRRGSLTNGSGQEQSSPQDNRVLGPGRAQSNDRGTREKLSTSAPRQAQRKSESAPPQRGTATPNRPRPFAPKRHTTTSKPATNAKPSPPSSFRPVQSAPNKPVTYRVVPAQADAGRPAQWRSQSAPRSSARKVKNPNTARKQSPPSKTSGGVSKQQRPATAPRPRPQQPTAQPKRPQSAPRRTNLAPRPQPHDSGKHSPVEEGTLISI